MYDITATSASVIGLYLDVDATVFIQIVVFWAVVGFLHFTLVKPYLRVVEAREEGIGGSREDAAEMEQRADQLKEEYQEKMQQARREAQEVRESLRNQGMQRQQEIVEEERDELQAKIDSERETIQQQVEEARGELEERSKSLASAMVAKILPES